jgi:hypothetical protein
VSAFALLCGSIESRAIAGNQSKREAAAGKMNGKCAPDAARRTC